MMTILERNRIVRIAELCEQCLKCERAYLGMRPPDLLGAAIQADLANFYAVRVLALCEASA